MSSHWSDDERFWGALDHLVAQGGLPLKNVLDILYEYREQLDPITLGIMFGGVGEFFKVYTEMRRNTNTSVQSFQSACMAVQNHRLMQQFMSMAVNSTIDSKVEQMGGQ